MFPVRRRSSAHLTVSRKHGEKKTARKDYAEFIVAVLLHPTGSRVLHLRCQLLPLPLLFHTLHNWAVDVRLLPSSSPQQDVNPSPL